MLSDIPFDMTLAAHLERHWALGRWVGYVGGISIIWHELPADALIAGIASLFLAFIVEKLLHRLRDRERTV